ncbi:hypothetical protein D3C73_1490260 [compost metagenome]
MGGTCGFKLQQLQCSFDADVVFETFCPEKALQQIVIRRSHPVGIVELVHAGILNDTLHVLSAPGQQQHAVLALVQPAPESGYHFGEAGSNIDFFLGNARLLLNKGV